MLQLSKVRRNAQRTCMTAGVRTGCFSPFEVVNRPIRVPVSRQLKMPHSTTEASPAKTVPGWHEVPWIHEDASKAVHFRQHDTIANETRQTRQRVFSLQLSNGGVGDPTRGVNVCAVRSITFIEWTCGSERPYKLRSVEQFAL